MPAESGPTQLIKIKGPKLLLVEEKDEESFFGSLLDHMGIGSVQVYGYGGKDKFAGLFPSIWNDLALVEIYAVTRDADGDSDGAFQSIAGVLKKHNEPVPRKAGKFIEKAGNPRKVGIYILPGRGGKTGMLEDLCLASVAGHSVMPCVKDFIGCLKKKLPARPADSPRGERGQYFPKNESKARAQAFLAAMDDCPTVGVAAQGHCWDFNSPEFTEMKTFLKQFR